jgi:chromosome segregation ATPase
VYKYQESSSLDLLEKELEQAIRDTKREKAAAEHTIGLARQEAKAAKEELKLVQAELRLAQQEKHVLASQLHTEKGARCDYGKQLAELRKDMRVIVGAAKGVEERLDLFVGAMEKEILEKKAVAEEELAAAGGRRSWYWCF